MFPFMSYDWGRRNGPSTLEVQISTLRFARLNIFERNFQTGEFEQRDAFSGARIRDLAPEADPRGTKSELEGGIQQKEVMPSFIAL